jgi:hypothetical protein
LERTGVRPTKKQESSQKASKKYYHANKEAVLKRHKKHYETNREKLLRKGNDYYAKNVIRSTLKLRQRKIDLVELCGDICEMCNNVFDPVCYDFHHRDPALKLFGITHALGRPNKYTREEFYYEVAKCDLLCKCCHALTHLQLHNERIGIQ